MAEVSTKPYLIRAIYDWCTDCGFTPHVAVAVDAAVRVPSEFVNNGEIVLNVSALATTRLLIDNEAISFQARFGGVAREVYVPMAQVIAVYARENGQGMAFEVPRAMSEPAPGLAPASAGAPAEAAPAAGPPGPPKPAAERPKLTRIK
jgi:stringent starvation protein B